MYKKMKNFIFLILMLCLFCVTKVFALESTLLVRSNSLQYYKITKIDDNKISCKFFYEYKSNQENVFNDKCNLVVQNNTIFIDAESKSIVKGKEAISNLADDMLISAYLTEDQYDVENKGIYGVVNLVVYNISNIYDNVKIDLPTDLRYYRQKNQFSFSDYLGENIFYVDKENVYDENQKLYNIDSLKLWEDIYTDYKDTMGEERYNIYSKYDFVVVYWLDKKPKIEKAFIIELKSQNVEDITDFQYHYSSSSYYKDFIGTRNTDSININFTEYKDGIHNDKNYVITFDELKKVLANTLVVDCEKQIYKNQCGGSEGCSSSYFYVYYNNSYEDKVCYEVNEKVSNFFDNLKYKKSSSNDVNDIPKIIFWILSSFIGLILIIILFKFIYTHLFRKRLK